MKKTLYDFCIENKEKKYLLDEWDNEKNKKTPKEVTTAIKEKSWWICKKGHSYESHIYSRIKNNTGCPYCSGRLPIKGETDLCTTHPHLIKEWDFSKNTIKPDEISFGSNKPILWICKNNHSYSQRISHRTSDNTGCPYCSGQKTLAGFNDLKTWCEKNNKQHLLKEWDYIKNKKTPTDVTKGCNDKVWWKCKKCSHEWKTQISDRTSGRNCPVCNNHTTKKGYNDLKTWCIENNKQYLLNEWNYLKNSKKPEDYPKSHNDSVWWICQKGHEWQARISNRTMLGRNCPYCSGQKILKGFNDLKTWCEKNNKQHLLEEWDYKKNKITPSDISKGFNKPVWWKCKSGHSWTTSVSHRTNENTGCPKCFAERQTSFSEQAIYYYIKQVFSDAINSYDIGNKFKLDIFIPSLCVGIEYDGSAWHKNINKDIRKNELCKIKKINLIRVREEGCPEMNNNSFLTIVNCKAIDVKKYIYDLDTSIKNVFHILEQLSKTKITINVNTERDKKDIYSTYKQDKYEKSLKYLRPDLLKEWDYELNKDIDPAMFTLGSHVLVFWVCSKGHKYQATIANRVTKHTGCPYCSGRLPIKGETDLCTTHPNLIEEWDFSKNTIKPDNISAGSNNEIWWKCKKCGNEWKSLMYSRKKGNGCPKCGIIKSAKSRSKKVKNLDTGEIFNSLKEAAKSCGLKQYTTISDCCKGKTQTSGGYHWAFL